MVASEKYTVADVAAMENHAELIGGNLVIQDMTSPQHSMAVVEIASAFRAFIKEHGGDCKVMSDTAALCCHELAEDCSNNYFLPDVMVVCDASKIDDEGVHTAPKFVAEVTSKATRKNDYGDKLYIYQKIGVDEYLVVDLQANRIIRYLKENDYMPEIMADPAKIEVKVYEGLILDLSEFIS